MAAGSAAVLSAAVASGAAIAGTKIRASHMVWRWYEVSLKELKACL